MFERVAEAEDFWIGEMRSYRVLGVKVLLARLEDGFRACEDRCAHLGLPLSQGKLEGAVLTCASHHWCYDISNGRGINPAVARLRMLPVRVERGSVFVSVEAGGELDSDRTCHGENHDD